MWAAPASWHFGAELCKSTDMGKTWDMPEKRRIKMPANTKTALENIWQIAPGAGDDTLYVGTGSGRSFESHDRGETWKLNSGLWKHKHRKNWAPGFGGLCLHTIITDKKNPNNFKDRGLVRRRLPSAARRRDLGRDQHRRQGVSFAQPISRIRPVRS